MDQKETQLGDGQVVSIYLYANQPPVLCLAPTHTT